MRCDDSLVFLFPECRAAIPIKPLGQSSHWRSCQCRSVTCSWNSSRYKKNRTTWDMFKLSGHRSLVPTQTETHLATCSSHAQVLIPISCSKSEAASATRSMVVFNHGHLRDIKDKRRCWKSIRAAMPQCDIRNGNVGKLHGSGMARILILGSR